MARAHEQDAKLMKRIAAGDQKACREALAAHLAPSWRMALAYTGRADVADDIAQEAMVRLWQAAPRWQAQARISTWLYRVVRNLCIDESRKNDARKPQSDEDGLAQLKDTKPDILAARQTDQTLLALQQAISALPARQRVAISLFYFDERSITHCAEAMEITNDAFQSLLARARTSLKDHLAGEDEDMLRDLIDG